MNSFYNPKPYTSLTAMFAMHLNKTSYGSSSRSTKHNVGPYDPNNMLLYDPNKVKEELFQLKTQMNRLKEKYHNLEVQNNKLKKENALNVKMISDIISEANKNLLKDGELMLMEGDETEEEYTRKIGINISPETKDKMENKYLIILLKKKNEEMVLRLQNKDQEIQELKQSAKIVKVNALNDKNIEMTQKLYDITEQYNRSKSYKKDYFEMREESYNLMRNMDAYKTQVIEYKEYKQLYEQTQKELKALQQKINEKDQKQKSNKEMIVVKGSNYKMTINSYQIKLKEKEKEMKELQDQYDKLRSDQMTITQPYEQREEKYKEKIKGLNTKLGIYMKKSACEEEKAMKWFKELDEVKNKITPAESIKRIKKENKALQEENVEMKNKLDKMNKEKMILIEENEKLKKEIEKEKNKVTEIPKNTGSNYNEFDKNYTEKQEFIDLLDTSNKKKSDGDSKTINKDTEKDKENEKEDSSYMKLTDDKNKKSEENNTRIYQTEIQMNDKSNHNKVLNINVIEEDNIKTESKDKEKKCISKDEKINTNNKQATIIAEELEQKKIVEEQKRIAEEELEQKKIAEELEKKIKAEEELERKKIAEDLEHKRIAEELINQLIVEGKEKLKIEEEIEKTVENQINVSQKNNTEEQNNNSKPKQNIKHQRSIDELEQMNNLNKSNEEDSKSIRHGTNDNNNNNDNINIITGNEGEPNDHKDNLNFNQSKENNSQNEDLEVDEDEDNDNSKQVNGNDGDDSEGYDNNDDDDNFSKKDSD